MATTGTSQPADPERVLHIRFERNNSDRIEDTLRQIDAGEEPEPYFECTFHIPAQLHQVTRPKNLELLRTIAREVPDGIREIARLVECDVLQVHRNVTELEELGLIEFEDDGRSKRPHVRRDYGRSSAA